MFSKHARVGFTALALLAAGSGGAEAAESGRDGAAGSGTAGTEGAALEPALLEVSVNGQAPGQPVVVLRDPGGAIYLSVDLLRQWHLRLDGLATIASGGMLYVSLADVAGLDFRVDEDTQTLLLQVEAGRLDENVYSYRTRPPEPMTPGGWGGFVNYEALAEYSAGQARLSGSLEVVAFSPHGFATSSFLGRWSEDGARATRLETNWTIDDPERMRSLRLGDGITRGGTGGGPLRFGGVQFARNFATQPGFVTLPMPTFSGSAALPSVVDVYVNNLLQGGHDVRPGPFRVVDVPIVTGSGEIMLVVRDLLGRETVMRQSYYAAPDLLRAGLHDYSYEMGFLRRNFGRRSNDYGAMFVSGTHRYGLSDVLTGEAHLEFSRSIQQAGVSASFLWPEIGLFSAGAAMSSSDRGLGNLVSVGFERRSRRLSIGAYAEFATEDFTALGTLFEQRRPAATIQAFAGMPLSFGSIGASYIWRDRRGAPDVEIVSANASIRVGHLGSLHLAARQGIGKSRETAVEVFVTIPLGARTHASGGVAVRDGATSVTADLQRNAPAGEGVGYRLSASAGRHDRIEGRLAVQTDFGAYDAGLTWSDGATGVRIVASGAVGIVGGRVFASRPLTQSFAAVRVGAFPGVRVYADNQLVGRTDGNGVAIIPRLRPFESNRVRIEAGDLPMDTELPSHELSVRPPNRSGVAVDFGARPSRDVIVNVSLEDGRPLPAGALLRLEGGERDFVSARGGDVYLSGLDPTNLVTARFNGAVCRFTLELPGGSGLQPRLDPVICRSAPS